MTLNERISSLHSPVLLTEIIDYLDLEPGDIIFDATLGGGGHSKEILKRILPKGKLIAVDRDPEAVSRNHVVFEEFKDSIILRNDNFSNINRIVEEEKIGNLDGVVFDLGFSSFQIDDASRGFSFMENGPLDMRYDKQNGPSAEDVVNGFGKEEIENILRDYGEERHAKLVARAVVASRKKKRIKTTGELVDIVKTAIGRKYYGQKLHPACRTFQALRIFVNGEIEALEQGVNEVFSCMNTGGRICVISFHSLEDRIVKNIFRNRARSGEALLLTKKPVQPTRDEIRINPRARSAKLRVAERTI